jgi:hypothetical protein
MNCLPMIDSSEEAPKAFDQVDVKSIYRLLTVVGQASETLVRRVERVYSEHAREFDSVLRFAREIGWITNRGERLELTESGTNAWRNSTEDSIRTFLLDAITGRLSPYRAQVAGYLGKFSSDGASVTYRPSLEERLRDSDVRNFLMDLRVVEHRRSDDCYVLLQGREDIFVWALSARKPVSHAQISRLQERKESLGRSAELAVLSYEQSRLGKELWPHIEHVSENAPYSPYDIKSVTIDGGRRCARFIEVKAVPDDTFRFYWSKTELDVAQLLAERYFVYLLPTINGTFDLGKMVIVQDPYKAIFQNKANWTTEENVVVCSRR